jgi:hypothetical protein
MMIVDHFLPAFDVSEAVATVVDADTATTWDALLQVDLIELWCKRPAIAVRGALARANAVPADNVYEFDASRLSKRVSANVSGMFGTARISLNDNLMNRSTPMFGLEAAREPDGFAGVAVRLSEYRRMHPGPVEEFVLFDHPSGWNRIHRSMVWKAEHVDDVDIAATR